MTELGYDRFGACGSDVGAPGDQRTRPGVLAARCRDPSACFSRDELLTTATIYWVTGTLNSANRWYDESRHDPDPLRLAPGERIEVPAGIAMFPGEAELVVPREFAERCYRIARWTDMPRGGHFPALEEPELLAADIRAFFTQLRP